MPRRGRAACRRWPTTAASRSTRSAARPGCIPPTGRRRRTGRDFVQAMTRTWEALEAARAPEPRTARFRCTLVLAWPDGHDEVFEGTDRGPLRLADARDAGSRLRPDVPAGRSRRDPRPDGPPGEEPDQPPGAGLRDAGGRLPWREDWQAGGFGVYVHWPFCAAKCPYCDFNSHVRRRRRPAALAAGARRRDRGGGGARRPGGRSDSVFFGGGTPSLMPPETVAAVIGGDRRRLATGAGRRGDARGQPDLGRGRALPRLPRRRGQPAVARGAGARRRATCGRSAGCTTSPRRSRAFEVARAIFPRVSFDLIYARQGQTLAAWRRELAAGAGDGGRPPVALPADDRARHPVRRPRRARAAARAAGGGGGGGHVPRDPGGLRRGRAARPTRSRTTRAPGRRAGTTSSTGATATMPGSARARTAG